jgi:hypothetical protein
MQIPSYEDEKSSKCSREKRFALTLRVARKTISLLHEIQPNLLRHMLFGLLSELSYLAC